MGEIQQVQEAIRRSRAHGETVRVRMHPETIREMEESFVLDVSGENRLVMTERGCDVMVLEDPRQVEGAFTIEIYKDGEWYGGIWQMFPGFPR